MSHFYHNRWFGKSRLLIPPFARFPLSVPAISYQKAEISLVIEVDPGDPWQLYVNNQLLTSGIGTGDSQPASGTLTRAMVADPATYLLTTANGMTASATGVVWGPDLLGAKLLSWHDETGAFDATGWAATGGSAAPLLAPITAQLPTTGDRFGRRTLVFATGNRPIGAAFTRNQPSESHAAAKFVGPQIGSPQTMVTGGISANGGIRRPPTSLGITPNRFSVFAGGSALIADCATPLDDRWAVFGGVFNGASGAAMENGAVLSSGNVGTGIPGGLTIGGVPGAPTAFAIFEIGEVITTTGLLTAPERTELNAYLSLAWPIGA